MGWVCVRERIDVETVGARLRAFIGQRYPSLRQFALAVDMQPSYLSRVLNQPDYRPEPETLARFAPALGVPVGVLRRTLGLDEADDVEAGELTSLVAEFRADPEFMADYLALGPADVDGGLVELAKAHLRALRRARGG